MATRELERKGVRFVWREQYLVGQAMFSTMIEDIDGNKINIFQTNTIIGNEKWDTVVNAEKMVDKHLSIWSDPNEVTRAVGLNKIYADNVTFTDPFFTFTGIDKLNVVISDLQRKYPGYIFSSTGKITSHHNSIKFDWNFGEPAEPKKITGTDVMILENGKIKLLYVFIDE
jgi:hypothetical protein